MEIDFSPLGSSLNAIFFELIKVLGVPLAGSLLIGLILRKIKVPSIIVVPIVMLLFGYGVYQMFLILDL